MYLRVAVKKSIPLPSKSKNESRILSLTPNGALKKFVNEYPSKAFNWNEKEKPAKLFHLLHLLYII